MSEGQGEIPQGTVPPAMQGDQGTGAAPEVTPGQGGEGGAAPEPTPNPYSLADGFLQQIPEADRDVVGRYVQAWDAGVTRRFQELHQEFAPYKELGADPQALQEALFIYRLIDEDPAAVLDILQQLQTGDESGVAPVVPPVTGAGGDGAGFQLPPEIQQRLDRNEQVLQALASRTLAEQQAQQQAAEDAALDQYLTGLKTEFQPMIERFGDFDEKFVLARMEAGEDGAAAVQAYYGLLQDAVNRHAQVQGSAPALLSGGGAPPVVGEASVTDLGKKDTRALVAQMITNANAQGQ